MISFLIPKERTTQISVGMIWLFHISGALGILYGNREFFLQTTPINLFFTLVLLFVNLKNPDRRTAWAAILAFSLGMLVEILGVNYGLIFGSYSYGENLGVKILGVPILIGANWVMLSFITGAIGEAIWKNNKIFAAISSAVLMVLIDLVIEPVAPIFDYWTFTEHVAPLSNYIGWFLVALPIQLGYSIGFVKKNTPFQHILCWFTFYFLGYLPCNSPVVQRIE